MRNTANVAVAILLCSYTAGAQHSTNAASQKSVLNLRGVISITYDGKYTKTTTSTTNNTTKTNSGNINKRNTAGTGNYNYTKTTTSSTNTANQQTNSGGINKRNTAPNGKSGITNANTNTTTYNNLGKGVDKAIKNNNSNYSSTTGYTNLPLQQSLNTQSYTINNTNNFIQNNNGNGFSGQTIRKYNADAITYGNNLLHINSNINYVISVSTNKVRNVRNKSPLSFLTEVIYTATQY